MEKYAPSEISVVTPLSSEEVKDLVA